MSNRRNDRDAYNERYGRQFEEFGAPQRSRSSYSMGSEYDDDFGGARQEFGARQQFGAPQHQMDAGRGSGAGYGYDRQGSEGWGSDYGFGARQSGEYGPQGNFASQRRDEVNYGRAGGMRGEAPWEGRDRGGADYRSEHDSDRFRGEDRGRQYDRFAQQERGGWSGGQSGWGQQSGMGYGQQSGMGYGQQDAGRQSGRGFGEQGGRSSYSAQGGQSSYDSGRGGRDAGYASAYQAGRALPDRNEARYGYDSGSDRERGGRQVTDTRREFQGGRSFDGSDRGYEESRSRSSYQQQGWGQDRDYGAGFGSATTRERGRGFASENERGGGSLWQERGPHSGRGPKGWRRSDERITEDVCEVLTRHPDIDATDIQVKVEKGDVTLSGTVESREAKRAAEEAVERCSGVTDVTNQLRVSADSSRGAAGSGSQQKPQADKREVPATTAANGQAARADTSFGSTPRATESRGADTATASAPVGASGSGNGASATQDAKPVSGKDQSQDR